MKEVLSFTALVATLLLAGLATGSAQEAPASKQTARRLELIITDDKGDKSISDVQAADIQLKENGTPATVDSLELIEKPVHYGLVVDVSNSLRSQFPMILDAARRVISSNTREDQTFVLRFVDKVEMVQSSTSNKAALFAATDQLKLDRGQTALFDALHIGATELLKSPDPGRRKALVVITDGENRSSKVTEGELFDVLREADFKVFIIGMIGELDSTGGLIRRSAYDRSLMFLQKLSKETGGRLFIVEKGFEPQIIEEVTHDLRRQYVLKYRSQSPGTKSRFKVEIKVSNNKDKQKRKAILRPSYTAQSLINPDN
ncbi:MAG TPA: VWA domain-containing protein [Pyrinomonadaceae bacterium]